MDLKELKALLRLMEGNDVEELEVEEAGRRVILYPEDFRSGKIIYPYAEALK